MTTRVYTCMYISFGPAVSGILNGRRKLRVRAKLKREHQSTLANSKHRYIYTCTRVLVHVQYGIQLLYICTYMFIYVLVCRCLATKAFIG